MKKILILTYLMVLYSMAHAQVDFYTIHDQYKEKAITSKRFRQSDIQPLIDHWKQGDFYVVREAGRSLEDRPVYMLSAGQGKTSVLLWSQMHGNESTATMAIFDVLNYLYDNRNSPGVARLLSNLSIHFVPMLNPDGAEKFQRRNAQNIDINRDALRLQTKEGQILKALRDSLDADFGFNLHDQSQFYNVQGTDKTATLSFLAPAYDYEKSVNEVRERAIKLIAHINREIQKYAPGRVGRYSDDFEPRAFGDNIQKWGTSTILIESGGYPDDSEKQEIRKLNFVALLSALYAIADGTYRNETLASYNSIPENDSKLLTLKINGITHTVNGMAYKTDIGLRQSEVEKEEPGNFYYKNSVEDLGDLSTYFGYKELDAEGLSYIPAKIYPEVLTDLSELDNLDLKELLKEGYGYILMKNLPANKRVSPVPLNLVSESFKMPDPLAPGENPAFFIAKDKVNRYVVMNGFLVDLNKPLPEEVYGLIER